MFNEYICSHDPQQHCPHWINNHRCLWPRQNISTIHPHANIIKSPLCDSSAILQDLWSHVITLYDRQTDKSNMVVVISFNHKSQWHLVSNGVDMSFFSLFFKTSVEGNIKDRMNNDFIHTSFDHQVILTNFSANFKVFLSFWSSTTPVPIDILLWRKEQPGYSSKYFPFCHVMDELKNDRTAIFVLIYLLTVDLLVYW